MIQIGKILCVALLVAFCISLWTEPAMSGKHGNHPKRNYNKTAKYRKIFGENRTDVPEFCNQRSCPNFTVSESNEIYEVRDYEETVWLTIDIPSDSKKRHVFRALFSYLMGNNSENRTIPMGVPVLKKMIPGQDKAESMSFYLNDPNPPKPNDSRLYIQKIPAMSAYVRVFSGYFDAEVREENIAKLFEAVQGENVEMDYFYAAIYNSPWKKGKRHDEIWMVAEVV